MFFILIFKATKKQATATTTATATATRNIKKMFDYFLSICSRILLFASISWTTTDLWFVVCSSSKTEFGAGKFFTPFFYLVRIPLFMPGNSKYSLREVLRKKMEEEHGEDYERIMKDKALLDKSLEIAKERRLDTTKIQEKLDFLEQTLFFIVFNSYVKDLENFTSISGFTKLFWGCQVFRYDKDQVQALSESEFWVKFEDRAKRSLEYLKYVTGRQVDYEPQMLNIPWDRFSKIGVEK